jgi:uncharacterized repeat protein (TIGR03803 family)
MINYNLKSSVLAACALAIAGLSPAAAGTYTVIYNMSQYSSPATLVEGSPGVFYTSVDPPPGIVSVTKQGVLKALAMFQDPPDVIESGLVTAANGLLYSALSQFSTGEVFSVSSTAGSEHTYAQQSLGPGPLTGNLPDGHLFGLAWSYPTSSYSLARVSLNGTVTPFYQFPSTDRPGPPLYHADGKYYGTSTPLVNGQTAYFYRVSPSGALTKIATLPFSGDALAGGTGMLVQATDGNFYGIQPQSPGCAPANQHGAVYKLTPSGQFTILHDFGPCETVNSLIEGSDGRLWGTTLASNVVFSLTRSGTYKAEFQMTGFNGQCPCFLLQGSDGIIYGAALAGGNTGNGAIFALDAGLPIPKPQAGAFSPGLGAVGTRVRIWGNNLFGASVEFNGVPAPGAVNSGPNYVWVDVPAGATTGPITVTTPGGTVTTRGSFTVN